MRTLRASEISAYLYCQRAWWYQLHGYVPENQEELTGGTELHYRHSRAVLVSGCLRVLAYALLLVAMVLLVIHVTRQLL
jgi:CRISPR/Cas system-associated exonuclease Cas4 (RecB family)